MKVFPVVHINSPEIAVQQTHVAFDHGADGVYLIGHGLSPETVLNTYAQARAEYPTEYIGVNLLGLNAIRAVEKTAEFANKSGIVAPSGLWTDDARTPEGVPATRAMEIKDTHDALARMRLLGGVAFKYRPTFTENPEQAAEEVRDLIDAVDVVTTSGAGTGTPPTFAKIAAMKAAAGSKPLAVASGISLDNMKDYVNKDGSPLIDEILVASSVETAPSSGLFDQATLQAFIKQARNLS